MYIYLYMSNVYFDLLSIDMDVKMFVSEKAASG